MTELIKLEFLIRILMVLRRISFCSIPRSAREILEHIGYSYHPTHISKYIKPLLELGFIEMTEPDKPNSKNQKYRKVRKE